jgi:phosphoglycolate phosphatase
MSRRAAPFHARGVLIDLDGTLIDTVADLAAAVNAMRAEFNLSPLPESVVANYVGQGAGVLVRRALTESMEAALDEARFAAGRRVFDQHYRRENGRRSTVYPEVEVALASLRQRGLHLACVTNKPREYTVPLLEQKRLAEYFDAVVSGGDTEERKPHPAPFHLACRLLQVRPDEVIVIGDSINDLQAGRAAGCRVVLVETGYNEGEPVGSLDADAIVPTLAEAARLIEAMPATETPRSP